MKKDIYEFLKHHVDLHNCGEHDMDNSYLGGMHSEDGLVEEFARWSSSHWDCTPIGICKENVHKTPGMRYYAMVFEDARGNRYYVHVPGYWLDEYEVIEDGKQAMEEARNEWYKKWMAEDYHIEPNKKRDPFLTDALDLGGVKEALEIPNTDRPDCKSSEPPAQPPPPPEPEQESETDEKLVKVTKTYFLCDAFHILENACHYLDGVGEIGTALGLQYIHGALQRIAARAAELDDPKLHILMLKLMLYDVDDHRESIRKLEKQMEENQDG